MSNTNRYRKEDNLIETIRALERRVSVLERNPRLSAAGINSGGITIKGGALNTIRDDQSSEGIITIGSNTVVNGEEGMSLQVSRSNTVPGAEIFTSGPEIGQTVNGNPALIIATVDGTPIDPDFRFQTIRIFDKSGNIIFADSLNARRGMSEPRLNITWFTANLYQTTTSTTAVDFAGTEWYFYHPHLRVRVLTQNDGGNESEIDIYETDSNTVLATQAVPAGSAAFYDLIINRSDCLGGDGPNGNFTRFSVRHRRTVGAGTIRTLIVEMLALDLSWSEPY